MMKAIIILISIILILIILFPVVLIARNIHDLIDESIQRTKERIKNMIPRWIRGK